MPHKIKIEVGGEEIEVEELDNFIDATASRKKQLKQVGDCLDEAERAGWFEKCKKSVW